MRRVGFYTCASDKASTRCVINGTDIGERKRQRPTLDTVYRVDPEHRGSVHSKHITLAIGQQAVRIAWSRPYHRPGQRGTHKGAVVREDNVVACGQFKQTIPADVCI